MSIHITLRIVIIILIFLLLCSWISSDFAVREHFGFLDSIEKIFGSIETIVKPHEWIDHSPSYKSSGGVIQSEDGTPYQAMKGLFMNDKELCQYKLMSDVSPKTFNINDLLKEIGISKSYYQGVIKDCDTYNDLNLKKIYPPSYTCKNKVIGQGDAPFGPEALHMTVNEWNTKLQTPVGRSQILEAISQYNKSNIGECRHICEEEPGCVTTVLNPTGQQTRVTQESDPDNWTWQTRLRSNCTYCSGVPSQNIEGGDYTNYQELLAAFKECPDDTSKLTTAQKKKCSSMENSASNAMCPTNLPKSQISTCQDIKYSYPDVWSSDMGNQLTLMTVSEDSSDKKMYSGYVFPPHIEVKKQTKSHAETEDPEPESIPTPTHDKKNPFND